MKFFVVVLCLVALATAGVVREKRWLPGSLHSHSGISTGYAPAALSAPSISYSAPATYASAPAISIASAPLSYAPATSVSYSIPPQTYTAPAARLISVNKLVNIPKVVSVPQVVNVRKVVSVPQVVTVNKLVSTPSLTSVYGAAPTYASGW